MIKIRRAVTSDAQGIAQVQVTTWRDTYAGVLPARYLVGMSLTRIGARWRAVLSHPNPVSPAYVAEDERGEIVAYGTCGPRRTNRLSAAEGEFYEIYVTPGAQGGSLGRGLIGIMAENFVARQVGSALVWVLKDNPARWFYQRLGGRLCAEESIRFAGTPLVQLAFVWPDTAALERLASSGSTPAG